MACTKYTLDQYNALNEAISLGAFKVQYGDKTVEYRTLSEMLRLQMQMENCLFPANNKNNGRVLASFSKGTKPCGDRRRYF